MIDTTGFAFAKPGQQKRQPPPAVVVLPGGREVCQHNATGDREYKRRTHVMWRRQGGRCCICGRLIKEGAASFEHEVPRGHGGGSRDDRIYKRVAGRIVRVNGASHGSCNGQRGSKRTRLLQFKFTRAVDPERRR